MNEEREELIRRLKRATGEKTKAGALDVAAKHYLNDKQNKEKIADQLDVEELRTLSTPWLKMDRRTVVGADVEFETCSVCQDQSTELQKHHVSYQPERTIRVCSSCHGKIHDRDGFHDDLKPEMSRQEAKEKGLV